MRNRPVPRYRTVLILGAGYAVALLSCCGVLDPFPAFRVSSEIPGNPVPKFAGDFPLGQVVHLFQRNLDIHDPDFVRESSVPRERFGKPTDDRIRPDWLSPMRSPGRGRRPSRALRLRRWPSLSVVKEAWCMKPTPTNRVARLFLVQHDHDSPPLPSMNHPSVDAILINDEIDFPSTATPASCGSGMLKRLLAAPFNAKAKPSILTM